MSRKSERRKKNQIILANIEKETIDMREIMFALGMIDIVSYEEYMEKLYRMEEEMDKDEWN